MQKTTHYDRLRLPVLVTRLRAAVAWGFVPCRALRLVGGGVGVSPVGSLAAAGIPKWADVPAHRALLAARAAQEGKY